jgi:hypothetical protein
LDGEPTTNATDLDRAPRSDEELKVATSHAQGDVSLREHDSQAAETTGYLTEGNDAARKRTVEGRPDNAGQTTIPGPNDPALDALLRSDRPGSLGRLGPYEVLERLGQGGMGIVLKALDERLGRMVAIKLLTPALAGNTLARLRFDREARAAAAV